jgi:hypothetical protein
LDVFGFENSRNDKTDNKKDYQENCKSTYTKLEPVNFGPGEVGQNEPDGLPRFWFFNIEFQQAIGTRNQVTNRFHFQFGLATGTTDFHGPKFKFG